MCDVLYELWFLHLFITRFEELSDTNKFVDVRQLPGCIITCLVLGVNTSMELCSYLVIVRAVFTLSTLITPKLRQELVYLFTT